MPSQHYVDIYEFVAAYEFCTRVSHHHWPWGYADRTGRESEGGGGGLNATDDEIPRYT